MKNQPVLIVGLVACISTAVSCYKELPDEDTIVGRGRVLFQDTRFSRDGTVSCSTCHPNGHMDDRKWHFPAIHDSVDGRPDSLRTLTLWGIAETGPPFLWDGSRRDLRQVTRLYTDTIMGGAASEDEIEALVAYQRSLGFPSNPYVDSDGTPTESQVRGKAVYETKGLCSPCHTLPTGSNGKSKDIGTGGTFRTPGLRSIYQQQTFFHDGRARSLREVIDYYDVDSSRILRADGFDINLTEEERNDLIAFLLTL